MTLVALFALVLAVSQQALAVVISASPGSTPSFTNSYSLAGTGWVIDDGSFPASLPGSQSVAYVAGAGPWRAHLTGGLGLDFAASDTGSGALQIFSVIEHLTIGGTEPWIGWHEEVLQPGFRWLDDRPSSGEPTFTYSSGAPIAGLAIAFTPGTTIEGGKIDFTFDPLPPGTILLIKKRLIFEGLDPLLPGETFLGKIDLHQYPLVVPEPSSLALGLSGWMALSIVWCARRRHERS